MLIVGNRSLHQTAVSSFHIVNFQLRQGSTGAKKSIGRGRSMFHKKKRIKQIIFGVLIFLATTGVLFAGERLAEGFLHRNPLQKEAKMIPEITDYQLIEDQSTGELCLVLSLSGVDNLQETVEPFIKKVERIKGRRVKQVEVKSPSTPELRDVYYELSFLLEEARISGRYQTLFTGLREMQREAGDRFRVYIGQQFLFVQLERGAGHYYAVLPKRAHLFNTGVLEGGGV